MPQQGPLSWIDGEGWLVTLGGGYFDKGETDEVDAQLLSVSNLDRPMIVLLAEGPRKEADAILDHYVGLGGPSGEAMTLESMSREQLQSPQFLSLLSEAGILYLGGENCLPLIRNLYKTRAFDQIRQGFNSLQGLSIIAAGGEVSTFGTWAFGPAPDYGQLNGFNYLENTVLVPHFTSTEASPILRQLSQIGPQLLGLGIPDSTALAFGPRGQVETWGSGQVTAVVSAKAAEPQTDTQK